MTIIFVVVGCLIAPKLSDPRFRGVFHYIQEFQGYISPGILAAFVFGFIFRRAPASAGVTALLLTAPVYGFLHWRVSQIAFLNRMAITFGIVLSAMAIITAVKPLAEPKKMPVREDFDLRPSPAVVWLGAAVIAGVITFYIVFW
jgi:SSS family solute:Na+ symporter